MCDKTEEETGDELGEIVSKHCLNAFRTGYVTIHDHVFTNYYGSIASDIENLAVFPDDVFVCSFPKTGTTWTQEMVWMIANNLDFQAGKLILAERFPFLEVTSLFDFTKIMKENGNFKPPSTLVDSVGFVNSLTRPRYIKTHLPYELLPKQILNNVKNPKIIYVARNPKDTCVSYYHHCRIIEGYTGTFDDFCKLFLGGRVCFGPFWKHLLGYWEKRHQENILFIKYEEMKKDLPLIINRVARFLGKELGGEQVEALVEHLSFESMRKNEAVNYESIVSLNRTFNLTEGNGVFMRSGTIGSYKAIMTPEIIQRFNSWSRTHLEGTDFSFEE